MRKFWEKVKSFTFTTTAWLLVLFFAFGFSFFSVQPAAASAVPASESFIIQLKSLSEFGELLPYAKNLQHLFLGSQTPEFKNIYSFDSSFELSDLQSFLKGDFNYLQSQGNLAAAQVVVDDPGFTANVQDIDKQWGLARAGFNNAWETTTGSYSNIVAVIDTGIDATHVDLKTINYVPGFDFIHQQAIVPGTNSDDNGHGTLVAGVLGATANNGTGIVGTNWQISIMPVKALDSTGKGQASTVAQGIVWAADHGAQFINLSIGGIGIGQDTTLSNAISYAFNKNVVIVAAAGNDINTTGSDLDLNPVYPICDDNNSNMVIGVAATDQNDLKADFSNYGKNCIDVDAPGKRILSTISFDPVTHNSEPNSYAYASGTSLAVPYVVGEAALIKAHYPGATNVQIRDRIISTADSIDSLNLAQCAGVSCAGLLGAGRIDVTKSLNGDLGQSFSEGELVKVTDQQNAIYQITGGQKRLVSSFVFNQKFSSAPVEAAVSSDLTSYPSGPYVTPNDGTLVKFATSPTVYIIQDGQKIPVTAQVFNQRKFSFTSVNTLSFAELNSWQTGSFLPPLEGTLLRTPKNKTVYWVVGQVLHPVNLQFYVSKGLNIFPIMVVPDADIQGYPIGSAYIS